jgi:hypothetical protein
MNRAMIASIIAAAAGAAFAQPVQWRVEDGGNGHWYEARRWSSPEVWEVARDRANEGGGYLACVTSESENIWLATRLNLQQPGCPAGSDGWHLGGYQDRASAQYSEPAGGWRWVSGEPWVYAAWYPGRPNNYGAGEDYLKMNELPYAPSWDDVGEGNCLRAYGAIIEWSADCNADGLVDKGQILAGELPDANNNGIPDWSVSIARQPVDQSVGVDQPVFFVVETVTSPSCTTPVAYRWQRRNPLVADETAADAWLDLQDGGGFLNTGTPSLTILRPTPALATGYRCRISGGCGCEGTVGGAAFTNTVNFGVACPADFNADGGIDFGDIEAFFERWENGC